MDIIISVYFASEKYLNLLAQRRNPHSADCVSHQIAAIEEPRASNFLTK
jgi:hypothetical protein